MNLGTKEVGTYIYFSFNGKNWFQLEHVFGMNQFRSRSYELRTRKDDFFDLWETNDNERFLLESQLAKIMTVAVDDGRFPTSKNIQNYVCYLRTNA